MATQLLTLLLLSVIWSYTTAVPAPAPVPGRIPKVYNALITSNQNLEPSKAFPVYQPVLHDPFGFSYQPAIFYGGDLLSNGLLPAAGLPPKEPQPSEAPPSSTPEADVTAEPSAPPTETPPSTPEPAKPEPDRSASTPAPLPPNTQSPIPLNEFGLPPQVLPLGHIDPLFNALPQFSPFTYRYPGVRLYDPYDPFSFSPYAGLSIYRPITNVLGHNLPIVADKAPNKTPVPAEPSTQTQNHLPPEPSDLNILNYSSKDPAIPNVPPPPFPQGGLKTDKSE